MNTVHKYPVGIQTFERLRKENYLYIDKTDLVWKVTKESPFVFLCRPRRFGKSLLSTTLDSYFKGQKELFEGLKIMDLETENCEAGNQEIACATEPAALTAFLVNSISETLYFYIVTDKQ